MWIDQPANEVRRGMLGPPERWLPASIASPLGERRYLSASERWRTESVASEDGIFRLAVDPARAGEIDRRPVLGDVDVTELRVAERSLEDVLMQLTDERR